MKENSLSTDISQLIISDGMIELESYNSAVTNELSDDSGDPNYPNINTKEKTDIIYILMKLHCHL